MIAPSDPTKPVPVIEDDRLSALEKLTFFALHHHTDEEGVLLLSVKQMSDQLGISLRAAQNAIRKMVEYGIISVHRNHQGHLETIDFHQGANTVQTRMQPRCNEDANTGAAIAPHDANTVQVVRPETPDRNKSFKATTKATTLSPRLPSNSQVPSADPSTGHCNCNGGEREKSIASLSKPQPFEPPAITQDDGTDFTPDPNFSARRLIDLWQSLGLPMGRQNLLFQQNRLVMLHRNDPHYSMADLEQAIRKIRTENLSWAAKYGPGYLADCDQNGRHAIEKVIAWKPLEKPAAKPAEYNPRLFERGLLKQMMGDRYVPAPTR